MKRRRRRIGILLGLLATDLISKLWAYGRLPPYQLVSDHASFQFVIRINRELGTGARFYISGQHEPEKILVQSTLYPALLGLYLIAVARARRLSPVSIALGIGGTAIIAALVGGWLTASSLPKSISIFTAMRLSQAFCALVVWWLVDAPWWRVGALCLAAAAAGNALSRFYPPYGIVDFIWSAPINRFTGLGIFNFADVLWIAAIATSLAALIRNLVIWLLSKRALRWR